MSRLLKLLENVNLCVVYGGGSRGGRKDGEGIRSFNSEH